MKKSKNTIISIVIIILVIAGISFLLYKNSQKPGRYDSFAVCLEEKDAQFYGAFWCPHCQKQKQMFGRSAKHLPYVECSTSDGKGQLQVCIDQNIASYPTWIFADGTRATGEQEFSFLAGKTGCILPQ